MNGRIENRILRATTMGKIVALLLIAFVGVVLACFDSAKAETHWVRYTITCDGDISGSVGTTMESYYFTIEMNNGTFKLKNDLSDGADVTSWFKGSVKEASNAYGLTPVGLTFKTVGALHNGDTVGHFVVTGTPWFAASHYLSFTGVPYNTSIPEEDFGGISLNGSIKFNIERNGYGGTTNTFKPSSIKLSGKQGTKISPVTLELGIRGHFIVNLSSGTDVSDWFRSDEWYVDYEHDQQYLSALLPKGLTAKLKKAVKMGDTSFTVEISGTPQHGSTDFIVWEAPKGYISSSGSAKNEQGYGFTGTICNQNLRYNISGDDVTPSMTIENIRVEATVGASVQENLVTVRLHNCTLTKTLAAGTNIAGWFVQYDAKFSQWCGYALEKFGSNLRVEVVRFVEGENYFTCKFTGTAKTAGAAHLRLWLENDMTTHSVRVWSGANDGAYFVVSDPDTGAKAYISERTIEMKTGFTADTSENTFEAGVIGGVDAESNNVVYALSLTTPTTVSKNTDVSGWFTGLPSGVKAYAAEACGLPSSKVDNYHDHMLVYLKGTPTKAGTYKIKFNLKGNDYATIESIEQKPGGQWVNWGFTGCGDSITSSSELTVVVTDPSYAGYAFNNSRGENIAQLSYRDFIETADGDPIFINGNIATVKYVEVTDGTAQVKNVNTYGIEERSFGIYVPKITISKSYTAGAVINDIVRLKGGSPISNYKIRTDGDIKNGTQYGLVLSVSISKEDLTIESSMADFEVQINNGSSWCDIKMPTGSAYAIGQTIYGDASPDTSKCSGLSASIADCSINGIAWQKLMDREGVEITVNGAAFKNSIAVKNTDITDWFTNLPKAVKAVVKETAEKNSKTLKVVFTRVKDGQWQYLYPESDSTDPIRVTIPLSALNKTDGSTAPWQKLNGGVVTTLNENAVWNVLSADAFSEMDKPMVVSNTLTGVYKPGINGIGTGWFEIFVYIPSSVYAQIVEDYEAEIEWAQNDEWYRENPDLLQEFLSNRSPMLTLGLKTTDGTFVPEYGDYIEISGSNPVKLNTSSYRNIYTLSVGIPLDVISASKLANGKFNVSMIRRNQYISLSEKNTYIKYQILDKLPDPPKDENGDEGQGNGTASDPGDAPDIWVNGKDVKDKNDSTKSVYNKTYTKALSDLQLELPENCKWVVSVTDTAVTEASGAYVSGKAKKSNLAKASFKSSAEGGNITVTAGKEAGIARVWIAAVDKKKEIKASAYFDVKVGIAPKKLYLTKTSKGEKTGTVKSIMLNMGDEESIFVNADGTDLSAYSTFKWDASSDKDGLLNITPSEDKQSATISLSKAPSDGKVKKVKINVGCNESGKKATITVMVANAVKSFSGLDTAVQMDSAAEKAVAKELEIEAVCSASGTPTDKIKVYVTTALKEGEGYQVTDGKKFTLDSSTKAKIKAVYKNGKFTVTAPKGTVDGTKVRVLIAVTHADKTVDVFESGVITIGSAT